MKPTVILAKRAASLLMISLLISLGGTTPLKQAPKTVGPQCSIEWDQVNDPKVSGYQLTVIDQSRQAEKTVRFIPADTTKFPIAMQAPTMKGCGRDGTILLRHIIL